MWFFLLLLSPILAELIELPNQEPFVCSHSSGIQFRGRSYGNYTVQQNGTEIWNCTGACEYFSPCSNDNYTLTITGNQTTYLVDVDCWTHCSGEEWGFIIFGVLFLLALCFMTALVPIAYVCAYMEYKRNTAASISATPV